MSLSAITFEELRAEVSGRGHPDYPFLSRAHSPLSRYPVTDFSDWIQRQIARRDAAAVERWLWEIVRGNPGFALGGRADFFKEHWQRRARELMGLRMTDYFEGLSSVAAMELHSCLFLVLIHDNLDGFTLAGDAPRFCARALVPYELRLRGVPDLVRRANAFIESSRAAAPFWRDFPRFVAEEIGAVELPRDASVGPLGRALSQMSVSARVHFFDAAHLSLEGKYRPIAETEFSARRYGVTVAETAQELLASGYFEVVVDPLVALGRLKKDQLLTMLTSWRVDAVRSWTKQRLVGLAIDRNPDGAREVAQQMNLVRLRDSCETAARQLCGYVDRMTAVFGVWLGFGVIEGRARGTP